MVHLTLFPDPSDTKNCIDKLAYSFDEAVLRGQASGMFYEVHDLSSGRTTDWTEVNCREEDNWIYDEEELIWKKQLSENYEINQSQIFTLYQQGIMLSA